VQTTWSLGCGMSAEQKYTGDRGGKLAAKNNADASPAHVMGLQQEVLWMRTAGTVTAVRQNTLHLVNIISYHT
jgi:hypothetical protein